MMVTIQNILKKAGIDEAFYPGKKLVKKFRQPGEYKSHCAIFDWRKSENVRVEIKPGLSGRDLPLEEVTNYPVSFQARTYMDIEVDTKTASKKSKGKKESEDGESGEGSKGKGGSSGGQKMKNHEEFAEEVGFEETMASMAMGAFANVMSGNIPEMGEITKMVVMGKELAKEAFASAYEALAEQLSQTKLMVMDLLKTDIEVATPGGGLDPKGNETVQYEYDIEKTGTMFGVLKPTM